MSTKYPGGFITKSPVAPTSTAASGVWTLDQQEQYQKAGTWPSPPIFIEDLFSTYLYTGNSSTQTITNGIDLSGNGGLVWLKNRTGTYDHWLWDTARGAGYAMQSNTTIASTNIGTTEGVSFASTGFSIGNNVNWNNSGVNVVSWTFRKQPKFFDIVTYSGNGNTSQTIAHNLGTTPGCIIVKRTNSGVYSWCVYHRSLGATKGLVLNATSAQDTATGYWADTEPTSTAFTVGNYNENNASGGTYIAYLFAHNAGGFPASGSGSNNGISCGTFTTDGSGFATVDLGYEPQWVLVKKSSAVGAWAITDISRGWVTGAALNTSDDLVLFPNTTNADTTQGRGYPTSTGFGYSDSTSSTYVYVAIRRGPMKTPTDGTTVFSPISTSVATGTAVTTGFPVDMQIGGKNAISGPEKNWVTDRLRGVSTTSTESGALLQTTATDAENTISSPTRLWTSTSFSVITNNGGVSQSYWNFKRAPGFFDEVCYTGDGTSSRVITHNLGVSPGLIISKTRGTSGNWRVCVPAVNSQVEPNKALYLDLDYAFFDSYLWSAFSSTSLTVASLSPNQTNNSGSTYVTYLFATLAGVSKVGSYSGTGATQTIDCGFTGGARFVLVKRTDTTGGWYVWDTARGMTAGTDPSLLLNSTAAQVNANSVYTTTGGFQIVSTAAGINASGGTYIFLAIA